MCPSLFTLKRLIYQVTPLNYITIIYLTINISLQAFGALTDATVPTELWIRIKYYQKSTMTRIRSAYYNYKVYN